MGTGYGQKISYTTIPAFLLLPTRAIQNLNKLMRVFMGLLLSFKDRQVMY